MRWWHDSLTLEGALEKYLPRIRGEEPTRCFIIQIDDVPIGMIQTFRLGDYPEYAEHVPVSPDAWGIDIYIGRADYLYRGLGSPILRAFMDTVLFPQGVQTVTIDPSVNNHAAIRAYEKAGFQHILTTQMPDEPEPTYFMVLERAGSASG